jgi:2-keto-3-deoxy-L-rhamnonate aldolase RhmA
MARPLREAFLHHVRDFSGFFIGDGSADLVEMIGYRGLDFVVVDAEHGFVWQALPHLIRAGQGAGLSVIVRTPNRRYDMMGLALDAGADGVLMPSVRTVEDVQAIVQAGRYAPEGNRGVAFLTRAARFELDTGPEALQQRNRDTMILVQIETREAVDHLEAILAEPGFDGIFVGPADLSVALGYGSRYTSELDQTIQRIAQMAEAARRPWGLYTASAELHAIWRKRGAYYCTTGLGNILGPGLDGWRAIPEA